MSRIRTLQEKSSSREYMRKHPEVHRRANAKYKQNPNYKTRHFEYKKNHLLEFWANATIRSHKLKNHIMLSKEGLISLAKSSLNCYYCGIKLDWNGIQSGRKYQPNKPTLDRLDNEDVLHKDNVVICCMKCNSTKQDRTFDEFISYCRSIGDKFTDVSTFDKYYMRLVDVVATRSSCLTRKVGSIIVRENHVLSIGYNGTPVRIKNCSSGGCPRCTDRMQEKVKSGEKLEYCLCVHAEANSIIFAARHGVSILGATLYTQGVPCSFCAKDIINSGIIRVVVREATYPDKLGEWLLRTAGVVIDIIEG